MLRIKAPISLNDTNESWFGVEFENGIAEVSKLKKPIKEWFIKNYFIIEEVNNGNVHDIGSEPIDNESGQ